MTWRKIKTELEKLPKEKLFKLLQGLHSLSPQNKAWLQGQLFPMGQDTAYLEKCRKRIVKLVYDPKRKFPDDPRFRDAKRSSLNIKRRPKTYAVPST